MKRQSVAIVKVKCRAESQTELDLARRVTAVDFARQVCDRCLERISTTAIGRFPK